jgi:hydroxymethylbilane synthase
MKKPLTIATRAGALAVAQTEIIVSALRKLYPELQIKIRKITTAGDKDKRTTLWELKSTGFFTSKLEDVLLAGKADLAVHSFKDLPTAERKGLTISAVFDRKFPEDCLISAKPIRSLDQLPKGARVGTSSLRRLVQLKRIRPDLACVPIRGNVTTRLRKLEQGDFDAIVLARAGLERLGLGNRISIVFDPAEFIPAPAQGALAVQTRADDTETKKLVAAIDDSDARTTTFAERAILSALGCGCHAPAGAFAAISANKISIVAFLCDPDGQNFRSSVLSGPVTDSDQLARRLATDILDSANPKDVY